MTFASGFFPFQIHRVDLFAFIAGFMGLLGVEVVKLLSAKDEHV